MPFHANRAAYRKEAASWDKTKFQYCLFMNGEPAGCVSSARMARRFVSSTNADNNRTRRALRGKR